MEYGIVPVTCKTKTDWSAVANTVGSAALLAGLGCLTYLTGGATAPLYGFVA